MCPTPATTATDDDRPVRDSDRSVTELIEAGRDREAALRGGSNVTAADSTDANGEPMDPLTQLGQVGPLLAGVVADITPDQLDRPTPCAEFTVRGVLEHMTGGATMFAAAYRGETPAEPDTTDVLAAFGPTLADLAAAMGEPGALDRTIATPFGDMPGDTFARYVVLDGLVHGWDLATATGQPYDPPRELVGEVETFAHEILDRLRDGQAFDRAVEPSPDATPIERLVAYTGRRPLSEQGTR